jgi:hypothetical protein
MNASQVCFSPNTVYAHTLLLLILIVFGIFAMYKMATEPMANIDLTAQLTPSEMRNRIKELQNLLHGTQLAEQRCQTDLHQLGEFIKASSSNGSGTGSGRATGDVVRNALLEKIYNPLVSPERYYPGGRFNLPSYTDYQMIGFIHKDNERYPLYGRHKYPGRSDRWEYYVIDETRNRLKIPFATKGDIELYSGDATDIPGLGSGFQVNIYEYESPRYNPNI